MKKTIGVILVIIAGLNVVTWITDASKGKSEGAIYYIAIIVLFGLGIYLISSAKSIKSEVKTNLPPVIPQNYDKGKLEHRIKSGLKAIIENAFDKVKDEPDVVQVLFVKMSATDYMVSLKSGYPSIVETSKKANIPVPYSKTEYEAMIDRLTVEVLANYITPINDENKWSSNPQDWAE